MADNEILCQPFVFISLYLQILFHRIKAWTSFHGIQIMMSHNQHFWKLPSQLSQQSKQSPFLLQCARILRLSVRIQSAFITSTYRVGIMIPAIKLTNEYTPNEIPTSSSDRPLWISPSRVI